MVFLCVQIVCRQSMYVALWCWLKFLCCLLGCLYLYYWIVDVLYITTMSSLSSIGFTVFPSSPRVLMSFGDRFEHFDTVPPTLSAPLLPFFPSVSCLLNCGRPRVEISSHMFVVVWMRLSALACMLNSRPYLLLPHGGAELLPHKPTYAYGRTLPSPCELLPLVIVFYYSIRKVTMFFYVVQFNFYI